MNIKHRIRDYKFLLALAAFIAMMGKQFNLFEIPDNYNDIVNAGLGLLIMLGIVTTPDGILEEYSEKGKSND